MEIGFFVKTHFKKPKCLIINNHILNKKNLTPSNIIRYVINNKMKN